MTGLEETAAVATAVAMVARAMAMATTSAKAVCNTEKKPTIKNFETKQKKSHKQRAYDFCTLLTFCVITYARLPTMLFWPQSPSAP